MIFWHQYYQYYQYFQYFKDFPTWFQWNHPEWSPECPFPKTSLGFNRHEFHSRWNFVLLHWPWGAGRWICVKILRATKNRGTFRDEFKVTNGKGRFRRSQSAIAQHPKVVFHERWGMEFIWIESRDSAAPQHSLVLANLRLQSIEHRPTFCGFPHQTTSRHFLWVNMPIKSKHMLVKLPKPSINLQRHGLNKKNYFYCLPSGELT